MDEPHRGLFTNSSFARLYFGQVISQLGTAFSYVALMGKYAELHGSSEGWPWVAVIQTVPFVAFGLLFGHLADGGRQRLLLVGSDLARAALFVGLALCRSEALFFTLVFSVAVFNSAFEPAYRSVVRNLISPRQLLAANAAQESSQGVVSIAGIGIAGIVLGLLGPHGCLLIDAGSYLFAGLNTVTIARLRAGSGPVMANATPEARLATRLLDGFRELAASDLRYPALLLLLLAFIVGYEAPLFFPLVEQAHWGGPERVGYLFAAASAGVLVTGFVVARRTSSPLRDRRVVAMVLALDATTVLAIGLLRAYVLVLPLMFLLGVTESLFRTYAITEIQGRIPEEKVGRVFAAISVLSKSLLVAASVLAGFSLRLYGARASFVVAAAIEYAAFALTLALSIRWRRAWS